jgi:hypothetical protein
MQLYRLSVTTNRYKTADAQEEFTPFESLRSPVSNG